MKRLVIPLGLAALVAGLAVLQYRWLGQVSDAERDRMRASVRARAAQIAETFDREITRAYVAVQLDPQTFEGRDWSRYSARLGEWRTASGFPRIVSDVLLAQRAPDGSVAVLRFDESKKAFEPAVWPERAAPLARWFAEGGRWPRPIWADVPALVQPVSDVHVLPGAMKLERIAGQPAKACIVALIDTDYVETEVLPALVRRHVGSTQGLEYDAVIRTHGEPRRVIYASDPARAGTSEPADATAGLFDLRLNLLADLGLANRARSQTGELRQFAISIVQRGPVPARADGVSLPGVGPFWELTLRHRAGSLEAVVAAARRRNLLLSSGILALLAASVGLVLLSARRAERLAAQQVEFVASVSHELRTPLAVIRSAGENLADGVVAEPAQVQRYGSLVRDEGQRLTDLVEQVLAYAGIQSAAAKGTDTRRASSLSDVVASAIADVREATDCSDVRIETDVPADLPPALADPAALRRALVNLLGNAIKYGGDAKWIGVTARASSDAGEVALTVADRGIEIAPADLPRIFDPFYRAPAVVAAQIHGTGLGLAVVAGIARAQGGRVTVTSTPGQGSAFTIHLRAANTERAERLNTEITGTTESLGRMLNTGHTGPTENF